MKMKKKMKTKKMKMKKKPQVFVLQNVGVRSSAPHELSCWSGHGKIQK